MRYHNKESGVDVDLGPLDDEKRRLFEAAYGRFRQNTSWFEFEQLVFSWTSPLFRSAKSRSDVLNDPLYLALKDMWLQLGINQGFVAKPKHEHAKTKNRPSRPHGTPRRRNVAAARQSARSPRRSR
ncbi:MAG TPA: hypothetical protein VJZ76_22780 [Thermoanaerobaculia bacterium]|nr:hypothetical protein [Thermoanaerobaculia bacterium]